MKGPVFILIALRACATMMVVSLQEKGGFAVFADKDRTSRRGRWVLFGMLITLLLSSLSGCTPRSGNGTPEAERPSYGVFIGANPDQADLCAGYDIVVIDAAYFAKSDIDKFHREGTIVYSYLNVGSIENFRDFFQDYRHLILSEYENWPGEYWVDVSDTAWQNHIHEQARLLVEKGVDGFFVDNADVYYQYHTPDIFLGMTTILNKLGQYEKDIIINGGDVFVTEAIMEADAPAVRITGVNQECVFTRIDFENGRLLRQRAEDTAYYQEYLARCRDLGLAVYLLEYGDVGTLPSEIAEYCEAHQFSYYASASIDLQ